MTRVLLVYHLTEHHQVRSDHELLQSVGLQRSLVLAILAKLLRLVVGLK